MVQAIERGVIPPPSRPEEKGETEERSEFRNEILLLVAAPLVNDALQPIASLSLQQEIDGIHDALRDLRIAIEIVVRVATAEVLSEVFRDGQGPLAIHFIGHGMQQSEGVALVLENNVGMARPFSANELRLLLGNRRRPPCQLAFLNACHSEGWAGELLRAGVPHVVAINAADTILDVVARCFAKAFYGSLFRDNSVQEAFEQGRSNIFVNDEVQQIIDPNRLQPINIREALKLHLLPGNSAEHQRSIAPAPGKVVLAWESKTNLSEDPQFVGRHKEMHELAQLLWNAMQPDQAKCVALHGMGGMGKTTLAKAMGRWQQERRRWRDGVWFVDLREARSIADAQAEVKKELAELPGTRDFRNLELLLILDDLDYLIGDGVSSGALEQWIESLLVNRRSRILITAREKLPSGVFNRPMEVLGLEAIAARQVFEKYVSGGDKFGMDRPTREAFQAVMELLDGYPLAIAIAAKYMQRQGCDMQDLQKRLAAEFPQVMGRSKDKNASLVASLNLSYDVLPPDAREMFTHLALFPGGLTIEVAQAIFGRESRDALETLTIYSMAERSRARAWRLPEPARKYAEDKQIPGAMARYAPAALKYFHGFCQQLVEQLAAGQTSQSAVESSIFEQQANLRHFLHWGYQQEQGDRGVCHSARVTALLAPFWPSVQPGGEPIASIDLATVAAQRCDDSLAVADLQKAKGDRQLVKQGLAVARASYDRAIKLYGSIQATEQIEQAQIQQKLGAIWDIYSDSKQAESCYARAFELYEAVGEWQPAARMKMAIGDVQRESDRPAAALVSYQAALEIYESLADRGGIQRAERQIRYLKVVLETSEPFAVVTVNEQGEEINRQMRTAQFLREILPGDVELEMISIPAGEFLMGAPAGEGDDREKPQHLVEVAAFFMGKYPITQRQ